MLNVTISLVSLW